MVLLLINYKGEMQGGKAHIIDQLKREILSLQGFEPAVAVEESGIGLAAINAAFPNRHFPLRAVHEFMAGSAEHKAATYGFISGMLSALLRRPGVVVWIGSRLQVFPHAFSYFGIDPEKIIFVSPGNEKDTLWAIEESIKCKGLSAVVGEIHSLPFDISRRLQLAVEKSRVTGFIINRGNGLAMANTCVSRWKITSIPGETAADLPGFGLPRWQVQLTKVRNGKPGTWQVEWNAGKFRLLADEPAIVLDQRRKTG